MLLLLTITQGSMTQEQSSGFHALWLEDYRVALERSESENKPVLINFAGSDWCKPCIKLTREVFETPVFEEFAKGQLVLLLLDFPRLKKNKLTKQQTQHNEQMAAKYNQEGVFPLVVLIDPAGEIIAKTGYRQGGADSYIQHLNSLINN